MTEPEPVATTPAEPTDTTPTEPVAVTPTEPEPATEPEPVAEPLDVTPAEPVAETADAEPAAGAVEPVETAPVPPVAEAEAEAVPPVAESAPAEPVLPAEPMAEPVSEPAAVAEPVSEPGAGTATPVVPAPRTPVDDALPPTADGSEAQDAPVESEPAPVAAGAAADTGSADDFRRIQGIGPKMAAALQDAGIRTYRQLADLDEAALRETIRAAGLRAAPSLATWPQQAKVLAGAPAEADRVLPAGGADA
ncbi:helix-hairpin-helix domain-containing protein [Micromonospora haikouensis]|uniref:helix-hairpin-helix domain-containing protein n=1 Tax=Micromonospora haikouensis TaxID=686309 RepID=UPI003D72CA7B